MNRHMSLREFRELIPDEPAARRLFEQLVWPQGAYCPKCGRSEVWRFRDDGRLSRMGLHQCAHPSCRHQFTATTRTPLRSTKLSLGLWLEAMYLILTSSKGVSSVVLARQLGVSQGTAWRMGHVVRLLMATHQGLSERLSGTVEVDTKRLGGAPRRRRHVWNPPGKGSKKPIVLVAADRGGRVKAAPVADESAATLGPVIRDFVDQRAGLMSDADKALMKVGRDFASHDTVNHGQGLYARGPKSRRIHSNSADRFAGTLERTKLGVFHFFSRKHLHRYVDEAAWRSSNREKVPRNSKGRTRWVLEPRPVLDLLADLLPLALGLQIRRERKSGGFREVSVSG